MHVGRRSNRKQAIRPSPAFDEVLGQSLLTAIYSRLQAGLEAGLELGPMNNSRCSLFSFLLASTTVIVFLVSCLHAATAEQQAVLAPVMALFDGMTKRDPKLIMKPLLTGGTMVLMREGKPAQMTFEAFAERVARPEPTHIEERIHDPLVRIDHDLAVVWARSSFWWMGR